MHIHTAALWVSPIYIALVSASQHYVLEDDYTPSAFASMFEFYTVSNTLRLSDQRPSLTLPNRATTQPTATSTTCPNRPASRPASSAPPAPLSASASTPPTPHQVAAATASASKAPNATTAASSSSTPHTCPRAAAPGPPTGCMDPTGPKMGSWMSLKV